MLLYNDHATCTSTFSFGYSFIERKMNSSSRRPGSVIIRRLGSVIIRRLGYKFSNLNEFIIFISSLYFSNNNSYFSGKSFIVENGFLYSIGKCSIFSS